MLHLTSRGMTTAMMEAPSNDDDDDNNDNDNALEGGIRHAASSSEGRLHWQGEKNRRTTDVCQPPRQDNINVYDL
jgi:hypothetical protein